MWGKKTEEIRDLKNEVDALEWQIKNLKSDVKTSDESKRESLKHSDAILVHLQKLVELIEQELSIEVPEPPTYIYHTVPKFHQAADRSETALEKLTTYFANMREECIIIRLCGENIRREHIQVYTPDGDTHTMTREDTK